jgi:DNA-directed RNA polymerase specialized sigma24 family protein
MQEQEALLASYDEANREAARQVKALEMQLKEREAAMVEERRSLERRVVRAVEAQQLKTADTAKNLRCMLSMVLLGPPVPLSTLCATCHIAEVSAS